MVKLMSNDRFRWGLSLAFGMLVLFWRVIIPSNVEFTLAIGALILVLDICLAAALIIINNKELKEAFVKNVKWNTILKIILTFVIMYVASIAVFVILAVLEIEPAAPAQAIGEEFFKIFPLGAVVSMVIIAPIWEETAFRMAGRSLIKNGFLFVTITSLLFAFIHTVNFSIADNLDYFISGVIFSVSYLITKDIRVPIGAHFLFNALAVVMGFFAG